MTNPVIIDRTQPNPYIIALLKYKQSGKLLDLGAGHGRHAMYFAQNGFNVTAVEPSADLCAEIKQKAKENHLQIDVIKSRAEHLNTDKTYDVIVCAMVLHFLEHTQLQEAIHKMKVITANQGLNVISAYTDQNKEGFMRGNPFGLEKYLLKPNELRNLYKDWGILEYSEAWTAPGIISAGDKPMSYHKINMIAKKPQE